MGKEARAKGTYEQRKAAAIARNEAEQEARIQAAAERREANMKAWEAMSDDEKIAYAQKYKQRQRTQSALGALSGAVAMGLHGR